MGRPHHHGRNLPAGFSDLVLPGVRGSLVHTEWLQHVPGEGLEGDTLAEEMVTVGGFVWQHPFGQ